MRDQLLHLSAGSPLSLQGQVREILVKAILEGHIPAGSALPSGRKLARQLGVARNTVVLAYQQLIDDGYLVSRERSGYYVSEDILRGAASPPRGAPATGHAPDWRGRLRVHPSSQRNVVKPLDWRDYEFPFVTGQFDPARFPLADWRECCRRSLHVRAVRDWAGDAVDEDDRLLIEQIHTRILPRRGVWAQPDEILVTVGAQQAIYLLARLLIGADTRVGMEDPGYPDTRNTIALKTPHLSALAIDDQGLATGAQLGGLDYVFVTPSHQYPTTVTMPLARRRELLEQAARDDFVIVEDDYESETNYVDEPTPALKSLDTSERVIYVGSLSKTLAPGLRIGYMVGPRELIREARALRRLMLRHPPANNQRTLALFLSSGYHDSLVRRLSHAYKERWQVLGRALAEHLPQASRVPTFGGTCYWVQGPETLDARELMASAARHSILLEAGDVCFAGERPPLNFFRLGFSSITVDKLRPGIERLTGLIERGQ